MATFSNRTRKKKKSVLHRIRTFLRRRVLNKRSVEGSVTIFLIIIMLPMLIFSCSVVDLCKMFMARNSTASALELTMNARLASYDDILKDMYGILASSANEDELTAKLANYYKITLESSTGAALSADDEKYVENFFAKLLGTNMSGLDNAVKDTNGLLNLYKNESAEFTSTAIATSSASNPEVMKRQIVDYMKYRGPVYLAEGGLDKIMAFADVRNQTKAAEAQLDYEKKLKEAGDTFNKVYTTLEEFLAGSERFQKEYSFSSFYVVSGVILPKNICNDLLNSVPSAYIASIYAGAYDASGGLVFTNDAQNAFDSAITAKSNISDAAEKLQEIIDEYSDEIASDAAKAEEIFSSGLSAKEFIRENKNKQAEELLYNKFGALFKNAGGAEKDNKITKFIKAYNDACRYSNYLSSELNKNTLTENRRKDLEEKQNELDDAMIAAEQLVNDIHAAATAIERFMEAGYTAAVTELNDSFQRLRNIYITVSAQHGRLEFLLGKDGIDRVIKDLKEAGEKADEYGKAIGKIRSESEKSNFTENYNSGAAKVKEITLNTEAAEKMKKVLQELKDVYDALLEVFESAQYLCDTSCNPEVKNPIVKKGSVEVFFPNYLSVFRKGHNSSDRSWYDFAKFESSFIDKSFIDNYFLYDLKDTRDIGVWDVYNITIKTNEFYDSIVKYGKNREDADETSKEKAKNKKNEVNDLSKKAEGMGKQDQNAPKETDSDSSEDNANLWFVPNDYPTFKSYIGDLEAAYKSKSDGSDSKLDALDSTSFSFDLSGNDDITGSINANFGGSDDAVTKGAKDMLASVGNFFADLLTAARDDLYIAEYLTENFPCVTTLQKASEKKSAETISGVKFWDSEKNKANVVCAHSSLEYILYGNMNSDSNSEAAASVAKASAVLFGVRFALNLIYALTSPALALEIEPIIAPLEVIPFAAPLARTVILIGLALGESGIDVSLLLLDQEVALFKTDATWICSIHGLGNGAKALADLAADKAGGAVDFVVEKAVSKLCKIEDKMATKLETGVDSAEKEINDYVTEKLRSFKEEVETDILNPITNTIRSAIDNFDPLMGNEQFDPAIIANDIDKMVSRVEENLGLNDPSAGNDILKPIEREILEYICSNKSTYAKKICDNVRSLYDMARKTADNEVNAFDNKVRSCFNDVADKIESKFKDATGELSGKIKSAVKETAETLKNETKASGEAFATSLKSGINEKLRGTKSANKNTDLTSNNTSSGNSGGLLSDKASEVRKPDKTLKVSYKDYLYVFTVLGLCFNSNNMLMRASQLMTANIEVSAVGSVREDRPQNAYSSNVTFDMNKAYTLFKGEAGSKTRTMFFGTTWNKTEQKWVHPASNVYTYKATTYVGY